GRLPQEHGSALGCEGDQHQSRPDQPRAQRGEEGHRRMILAVSTGIAVLSLIGLAVGLFVLISVLSMFNRIVRPAGEISRYAQDILDGGIGIAKNLEGVDELAKTRDLATSLPALAVAYLEVVKKELP